MSVYIKKNKNYRKAVSDLLDEIDFNFGKKVFIKPNLCGRLPILPGENSSFEVTEALIDELVFRGCEVLVGHGALLGSHDHKFDFKDVMKTSGFGRLSSKKGVKLIDLDSLERTVIEVDEMKFNLPLNFFKNDIDTYINLAKIKTHMEATLSFCLKNQMGIPSQIDRINMHKTNLEKMIATLAVYCKPNLCILEGYPAMEDNGPHHGTPKDLNVVVAGTDIVELDSFVSFLLGYDPQKIKHIKMSEELGIGRIFGKENLEKYKDFFVEDFKRASKEYRFGGKICVYPTFSCSRCIHAVNNAGRKFKKNPFKYWKILFKAFFSSKKINVVFGRADLDEIKMDGEYICIGSCSSRFAQEKGVDCLDKCPPGVEETKKYLIDKLK